MKHGTSSQVAGMMMEYLRGNAKTLKLLSVLLSTGGVGGRKRTHYVDMDGNGTKQGQ
jgi:hypothetical protein